MSWISPDVDQPAGARPDGALSAPGPLTQRAPDRGVGRVIATLDPVYFGWVMASGIVSIGLDLTGYPVVSQVVFVVTVVAFVLLVLAYAARAIWYWASVRQTLRDPTTAMAYFTVVAGTSVLASRMSLAGHPLVTLGLGAAAAVVWLVLTYGLPWSIVASARRPVLRDINGLWLLWVVATQSLAIVAAALAPVAPSSVLRSDLPAISICLWGVGVMLYFILIAIVFLRLLLVEVTPAELAPAYWIAMGATAISVRAAAGILALRGPHTTALVDELRPFLIGLSVVLWAFGTWWIPLLVALGVWRYVIRRYPTTYEPRLWSVVFPLGMYAVASTSLGRAADLDFMKSVGEVWVFVGLAAWAGVQTLMLVAAARGAVRLRAKS